jgi:hypothetical protein
LQLIFGVEDLKVDWYPEVPEVERAFVQILPQFLRCKVPATREQVSGSSVMFVSYNHAIIT